jgi:Tol biopolymer transport system component
MNVVLSVSPPVRSSCVLVQFQGGSPAQPLPLAVLPANPSASTTFKRGETMSRPLSIVPVSWCGLLYDVSFGLLAAMLVIICGCQKEDEPLHPLDSDLRYLVYGDFGKVIRTSEDGTIVRTLTTSSEAPRGPICSPDGSWIAYYSNTVLTSEDVGVWIMHQDGTGKIRLTDAVAQGKYILVDLQWSADSRTIFFESPIAGSDQIYAIAPVAGSTARKLTDGEYAIMPRPSPDLAHLAYRGSHQGIAAEYILELNSSAPPRPLLSKGKMGIPKWSPNGELLCFGANLDSVVSFDKVDLYTCKVDGSALTRLTTDGSSSPRDWSPDGKRILYLSRASGASDLCLMNVDGSGKSIVFSTPNEINNAHFSPDGLRLAFSVFESEPSTFCVLYTLNLDGTGVTKISSQCEVDFSWCR